MRMYIFVLAGSLLFSTYAETLFQVKDSLDRVVLDVSTDGLRVLNEGDTVMVISSTEIKAVIDNSKALSRSFSVATSTSGKGQANVLEVTTQDTKLREGSGNQYTDFSPQNIFLGINAGTNTTPQGVSNGRNNIFIGNTSGFSNTVGRNNVFFGQEAGRSNAGGTFDDYFGEQIATGDNNIYIGTQAGMSNSIGYQNVVIGSYSNMAGSAKRSTFVGRFTGWASTGYDNVFVGTDAARYNTYGDKNVVIGEAAGYRMGESTAAFYNTFVGDRAGFNNTSGSANVFLGNSAGYGETGSNKLYIANSNTSTPLIKGTFPNTDLTFKATTITADGNLTVTGNNTVNGNSSVIGTATSTGLLSTGNHLRITNNPGTGALPTYYAYQGATGSTAKSGAFAINDALWVTKNAFIDGTTNMTDRLRVESSGIGINNSTGYFYNAGTGGIALSAIASTTDVVLYVNQSNTTSATANIVKFASDYGGWSEKVYIQNSGKLFAPFLGSGTGTYLQVTTGGEIVKISSSRKYKKEIENLSVDPSKFMKLQPVSFKWNEKSSTENKEDYGLIAEDVEKIDPLLAVYDSDGMIEGVDYQKINIMLLKVVQGQQKAIEELRKEIDLLKETAK